MLQANLFQTIACSIQSKAKRILVLMPLYFSHLGGRHAAPKKKARGSSDGDSCKPRSRNVPKARQRGLRELGDSTPCSPHSPILLKVMSVFEKCFIHARVSKTKLCILQKALGNRSQTLAQLAGDAAKKNACMEMNRVGDPSMVGECLRQNYWLERLRLTCPSLRSFSF